MESTQEVRFDRIWFVRRTGKTEEEKSTPWLMARADNGIREFVKGDARQIVYTALWCSHRRDAKMFLRESEARAVAASLGKNVGVYFIKVDGVYTPKEENE